MPPPPVLSAGGGDALLLAPRCTSKRLLAAPCGPEPQLSPAVWLFGGGTLAGVPNARPTSPTYHSSVPLGCAGVATHREGSGGSFHHGISPFVGSLAQRRHVSETHMEDGAVEKNVLPQERKGMGKRSKSDPGHGRRHLHRPEDLSDMLEVQLGVKSAVKTPRGKSIQRKEPDFFNMPSDAAKSLYQRSVSACSAANRRDSAPATLSRGRARQVIDPDGKDLVAATRPKPEALPAAGGRNPDHGLAAMDTGARASAWPDVRATASRARTQSPRAHRDDGLSAVEATDMPSPAASTQALQTDLLTASPMRVAGSSPSDKPGGAWGCGVRRGSPKSPGLGDEDWLGPANTGKTAHARAITPRKASSMTPTASQLRASSSRGGPSTPRGRTPKACSATSPSEGPSTKGSPNSKGIGRCISKSRERNEASSSSQLPRTPRGVHSIVAGVALAQHASHLNSSHMMSVLRYSQETIPMSASRQCPQFASHNFEELIKQEVTPLPSGPEERLPSGVAWKNMSPRAQYIMQQKQSHVTGSLFGAACETLEGAACETIDTELQLGSRSRTQTALQLEECASRRPSEVDPSGLLPFQAGATRKDSKDIQEGGLYLECQVQLQCQGELNLRGQKGEYSGKEHVHRVIDDLMWESREVDQKYMSPDKKSGGRSSSAGSLRNSKDPEFGSSLSTLTQTDLRQFSKRLQESNQQEKSRLYHDALNASRIRKSTRITSRPSQSSYTYDAMTGRRHSSHTGQRRATAPTYSGGSFQLPLATAKSGANGGNAFGKAERHSSFSTPTTNTPGAMTPVTARGSLSGDS